jgi:Flp pilus assembly protein TadG
VHALGRWRGGLDRLAGRRRGGDDRGAVAVLVAILLASGVLLGFLALVVDVGRIYAERSTLQAGADAAALAIARDCAAASATCDKDLVEAIAERYANANSPDGVTNVVTVCGDDNANVLTACPEPNANLTACLGEPPDSDQWVEVRVSTELPGGGTLLPPMFAQAMAGNGGYEGADVGACARASWGPRLTILGLAISTCDYQNAMASQGGAFAPAPPYTVLPAESWEYRIDMYTPSNSCRIFGGQPAAGFINGSDDQCEITTTSTGEVTATLFTYVPLAVGPQPCENRIRAAWTRAQDSALDAKDVIIYIPLFDADHVDGTADNPTFHIVSVAPYVVTAFQFGPPAEAFSPPNVAQADRHRERSWIDNALPCLTEEVGHRCLVGMFVGEPTKVSALTGSNAVVRLVG